MSSSGRRSWSGEQKQRIIEATLVPGASVAEVARQ
ncbi:transposase [Inquilinus limosus]